MLSGRLYFVVANMRIGVDKTAYHPLKSMASKQCKHRVRSGHRGMMDCHSVVVAMWRKWNFYYKLSHASDYYGYTYNIHVDKTIQKCLPTNK